MAIKVSTGLSNELAGVSGFRQNLTGGRMLLFSGSQPANADSASSGTLLGVLTDTSGAHTGETLPVWKITLSGTSGTLDTITIGGLSILPAAITFAADLPATAAAAALSITNAFSLLDFKAVSSGADILISGPNGSGALLNSMVCAATTTTLVATVAGSGAVFTSGVTALNGLQFTYPAVSGVIESTGTWSGVGVADGVAGSFRYCCDAADAGTSASTTYRRIDGSITVTGGSGNATIDNTSVSTGQVITGVNLQFSVLKG